MSCFRIGSDNYYDSQIYANVDVSSEDANFPATNSENKKRRAKVWRSGGYFNVTSSNNTLIFEETTSSNLTATITAGEYTSVSSFLAAVKSALDSAGASVYTVSQDSTTKKIVIASDGAGGGGILNLEWDNASTTCEDLLGFDNSATDTGALSYTADFLRINSEEFITIDFGLPTDPAMFVMTGRRNSGIQISSTATIKLQANPTDTWSSPAYDQTLTYDDDVIHKIETTLGGGLAGTTYRYWRFSFSDVDNPNAYLEVAKFFLGDTIGQDWTGKVVFPLSSNLVDQSTTLVSEGGTTFSLKKQKTQQFTINWFNLKKADVEAFETFYKEFGISVPLFVSMDEDAVYSSAAQRRIIYAKMTQPPAWNLDRPNLFTLSQVFQEEV